MKRWLLFLLTIGFLVVSAAAKETEKFTVNDVIKWLIKGHPGKVVGWERNMCVNNTVDFSKISTGLKSPAKLPGRDLTKIINQQTGYQCQVEGDFILVFPKSEGMPKNGGLAKRSVAFPAATGVKSFDYLQEIQAATEVGKPWAVGPSLFNNAREVYGDISMEGGTGELFSVLNQMARKLNCRCWVLDDKMNYDEATLKPIMPSQIYRGHTAFFPDETAVPFFGR